MICLAVNTANTVLSVELVRDGEVLHYYETTETRNQGNLLLQHVKKGLEVAGLKYADIDLLAVVTGPGSFTGIRIGLATLRGIAMAADLPIVGVTSFEIFRDSRADCVNIIAIESWREELYFTAVGSDNSMVVAPVNEPPADFLRRLPRGAYSISGDAAHKLAALLPEAKNLGEAIAAGTISRCAVKKFKAQGGELPLPFYMRDADVTISNK